MRSASAGAPMIGEHEKARTPVVRVWCPREVTVLDQVRDEFACCLLGDAEVFGQLSGGGRCFAEPGERKAVHGAYVEEAAFGQPLLHAVDQFGGQA